LSLCLNEDHGMKAYWGNGRKAPHIRDFGTGWKWVVSFTPRPLYSQGKSLRWQLDRKLGVEVKRKIPSPRRKSNPRTPITQPVA